jgi:hypothetical protein
MQTQTTRQSPVAAVFTAEVTDFPSWKRDFNSHAQLRREAGITFTHINHDAENPNLLTVYLAGPDAERVRAFVCSPELKARMRAAGVKSAAEGELFQPVEDHCQRDALAAAIVRHTVGNFDVWKAEFDKHAPARTAAGIVGHAVSRKVDEPNDVLVYLQAKSLDTLRTFLSSPDLAAKMKAAGIEATVRLVHGEQPQN